MGLVGGRFENLDLPIAWNEARASCRPEFYDNPVQTMERPDTIMIASMTRRNMSGWRCSTKRLAMKAPNISEEPAVRPCSAISGVNAPKWWKVADLLTYMPSELAASVARKAPLVRP